MRIRTFLEGKQDFWGKLEGSEYMIREVGVNQYEITKWTRGDTPTEIYRCYNTGKGKWTCDCPARGTCKHIKMVKDWIKKGKTPAYDVSDIHKYLKKYLYK
uniref:SWIM-type domain-containing protein n=1 Tax=viral metagenome TaxID=1070528 RepID=A0A6M3KDJ5_9ZZZZ